MKTNEKPTAIWSNIGAYQLHYYVIMHLSGSNIHVNESLTMQKLEELMLYNPNVRNK